MMTWHGKLKAYDADGDHIDTWRGKVRAADEDAARAQLERDYCVDPHHPGDDQVEAISLRVWDPEICIL